MGFDPVTLGIIVAGTQVAASAGETALSTINTLQQAKALKATGEANARQAELVARNAEDEGAEAAHRQRIEKRRALSEINAQAAASGAVMSGSPLSMAGGVAKRYELDIADTTRRARVKAQQYRFEGEMARYQAKQQARSLKMSAYTTLLKGGADFAVKSADFAGKL